MSIAFLFPGQGSQAIGMLRALPDHPTIKRTLDEVSQYLGADIRNLDSAEELKSSVSVQLALLTSGTAMARTLRDEGARADAVAGLSVGAFAAAVHSGVISLAAAVRLVHQRAEMMAELYPSGYGLAVLVGLTERQVSKLVGDAYNEKEPVYLANINAPLQVVIAGSNEGLARVMESARKTGARNVELLSVSVPSHCPLLEPVAGALRSSLGTIQLQPPTMIYVGNVDARPLRSADLIGEDLVNNVSHQVRWADAITVLEELGCRLFLEMAPGHTLSELTKQIIPGMKTCAVGETSLQYALNLASKYAAV